MGHKPINMKPLAMVGLLAASFATIAADGDNIGTVTFKTAPEAKVTEVQGLNFGDQMAVAAGATCIITATDGLKVDSSGFQLEKDATKLLQGGKQCGAATDTPIPGDYVSTKSKIGIFEITGVNGQQVDLALSADTTDPYLQFTPQGEYWSGGLTTKTEAAPAKVIVGASTVTLGAYRSLVATQPHPQAIGTVVVFGTLVSRQALETSKEYTMNYTLDVTYL
ncbi:hypothetical protein [Pseudoalteromonas tunicata]|uniref:hypothetical protein n=1 Tax=Pseudoalteromonas tunicata TaxID=314281 RepID=UPI00273E47D6|nr:hypothetical protein [Pseudoalteromonas tunicata]MDP4985616.1 hypothetical protein [Pseudoalteromonas tunicata]